VLLGYGLSSAARPFIAITTTWTQVVVVRVLDRMGKGVRTAPRDAMLAVWATPATRGKVYGFHQAMDNFGAVVGPVLATFFLLFYPGHYRALFAATIVPGAIAVLLIFFVPDDTAASSGVGVGDELARPDTLARPDADRLPGPTKVGPYESRDMPLPRRFHLFIAVLALFMLANSTDAFLLLRLTDAAGGPQFVPLMWAGLHVVKTAVSVVGGSWSDRIGRRAVIAIGWLVYAVVYGGFAISSTLPALLGWFLVYGAYYGFAEGTQKALVADLAPASRRGTAFGIYNAVTGLGALAASVVFGVVWKLYGAPTAFGVGATFAVAATALLFIVVPPDAADASR
jgi:MFS family permease